MSAFGCYPMFPFYPSSSFKKPRMPSTPPLPEEPAPEAAAAVVISREPFRYEEAYRYADEVLARPQHEETLRLYTRGSEGLSLAVHDGRLGLVSANVHDESQHWVMEKGYYGSFNKTLQEQSNQYKYPDPPCFALANVKTGEAIARRRDKDGYHVSVATSVARQRYLDTSVLWESTDEGTRRGGRDGHGFRCICSANEEMPMYIAFDGAGVVLRRKPAKRGNSYQWKIVSW